MLVKDPLHRINVSDIWRHTWFKGYNHFRIITESYRGNNQNVDEIMMEELLSFGFPISCIKDTVRNQQMNHISATLYLLKDEYNVL